MAKFSQMNPGYSQLTNVEMLPEVAAISGGLKALCTYLVSQGIEDCRKCCGGNGYLMVSGVAPLAANYVWQTTAEGDWTLLMLQTAFFLLKTIGNAAQGQPLSEVVDYLAPLKDGFDLGRIPIPQGHSSKDYHDLDLLLRLYRHCAMINVATAAKHFQEKLGEMEGKYNEAFNRCAVELVTAVRIHCFTFMLMNNVRAVAASEDAKLKRVLGQLCALFACSNILEDPVWVGFISFDQLQFVKEAVPELLAEIRPNALALVDAFDFPDKVLNSAIGRFDGNVYEALYEAAQKAPLNQKDPFDGYNEYLRPHLDLEFLKKGNKL